jgi:hypothetical protein
MSAESAATREVAGCRPGSEMQAGRWKIGKAEFEKQGDANGKRDNDALAIALRIGGGGALGTVESSLARPASHPGA